MSHASLDEMLDKFNVNKTPFLDTTVIDDDPGIDGNIWDENSLQEEIEFFRDVEPTGFRVLIRMYSPPTKTKTGLIIMQNDIRKYSEDKGVVLKLSPWCYKLKRYEGLGSMVQVGDWVQAPRANIDVKFYKGRPYACVIEDAFHGKFNVKEIQHFGTGKSTY